MPEKKFMPDKKKVYTKSLYKKVYYKKLPYTKKILKIFLKKYYKK